MLPVDHTDHPSTSSTYVISILLFKFDVPPALSHNNIQIQNGFDDQLHCYPIIGTQNAPARVRRLPKLKCQTLHAQGLQGWIPVRPVLTKLNISFSYITPSHIDSAQVYGNEAQVADTLRASRLDRGDKMYSSVCTY